MLDFILVSLAFILSHWTFVANVLVPGLLVMWAQRRNWHHHGRHARAAAEMDLERADGGSFFDFVPGGIRRRVFVLPGNRPQAQQQQDQPRPRGPFDSPSQRLRDQQPRMARILTSVRQCFTQRVAPKPVPCWVLTSCILSVLITVTVVLVSITPVLLPRSASARHIVATETILITTTMTAITTTTSFAVPAPRGSGSCPGFSAEQVQTLLLISEACTLLTEVGVMMSLPPGEVSLDDFEAIVPGSCTEYGHYGGGVVMGGEQQLEEAEAEAEADDTVFVCPAKIAKHNELRARILSYKERPHAKEVLAREFGFDKVQETKDRRGRGGRRGAERYKAVCLSWVEKH